MYEKDFKSVDKIDLNLDYYKGMDEYSDGDIEDYILELVKNVADFDAVIKADNRWPVLYHLSSVRQNLLHAFEFEKNESVLEIGAGCGALTGLLCDKFTQVTAVELSKRRGEIIAYRNRGRKNLEIIIGNLNDIELEKKFSVITLIGVLEYAGKYTKSQSPYKDFLSYVKSLLKPDGQLIVAIENRYGLKYWAGFREDHLGKYFASLEGYDESLKVKTFGRLELETLLNEAGFSKLNFYYPFPDYKLPTKVFSEEYSMFKDEFDMIFANYDMDRVKLFDEIKVIRNLVSENQLDFFSNSFLIFAYI